MDLPLPLDQFRFNIVLRTLITAYGASGIGNLLAFIPGCTKEDNKIMGYSSKSNYLFWLISSLLFLLLGISQYKYISFVYASIAEIYIIVIIYIYLIIKRWHFSKKNKEKAKEMKKKKLDEIYNR